MVMRTHEKPKGTRSAGYIRVSYEKGTGGRAEEKDSPEAQKMTITNWCRNRGVPVPTVWYQDVEGRNPRDLWDRPQFLRMIESVKEGKWDFVAVDSQERFGCGHIAFNHFLYHFVIAGCQLWSVADDYDLANEDDDGSVFRTTMGNVASKKELKRDGERQVSRKRIHAAQGEWQGGYVPYAFDVVCLGPDRHEKFRVIILKMVPTKNIWHRVRVWPDGRQERFDGPDRFPVKEQVDKFFLAPSLIGERVANAKEIFELFASGAWTQRGLCKRLNDRGVDPVYGEGWYASKFGVMLRNPVYYIGQTVWGKKSHGKNAWYVGGEYVIPPRRKGTDKAKTGRVNKIEDWIFPSPGVPSVAIVDKKIWDDVQVKLQPDVPRQRGLRNPDLWLAGLLYCGRCGQKMDGLGQEPLTYCCRTYRQFGTDNKPGCRLHQVRQDLLEALVLRYLEDVAPQVKMMLDSREQPALMKELFAKLDGKESELFDVFRQMREFVREREVIVNARGLDELNGYLELYQFMFEKEKAGIEAQLRAKEKELAALMAKFEKLPAGATVLQEMATKRLVALDAEVRALRDKLAPLTSRLDAVYADLAKLDADLEEAHKSLEGDNCRRRAESVRKVIGRISLNFQHFDYECRDRRSKAEKVVKYRLTTVEFHPVMGEAVTLDAQLPDEQLAGSRLMVSRPGWRW